ncbi:lipid-binding serum glycoprotein family protein [Rhynchospora pubera]|uniref:Lipid-binding serum glycoprotein family protein n=1 Tax=Rhynchospora pubera TaxID=906938 RepID=A0AAV8FR28_9POAL|nr:lipid-binding serum glycoprotein family protein [Rhynchospora pubera]
MTSPFLQPPVPSISMAPLLLFSLLLLRFSNPTTCSESHISAIVSSKGIDFVKDLLVNEAVKTMTPLDLPDIQKTTKIPLVGYVTMVASDLTLYELNVTSSSANLGDSGVEIVASGVTADMSMDWSYSYTVGWIKISDKGNASVRVEGMEVGLTMIMKSNNGSLELTVSDLSCYIDKCIISLNGGASWLYQGFVNAFKNHIRSAVEKAIIQRVTDGSSKLNALLQKVPKSISLDHISSLNLTLVSNPIYSDTSIEFDINGLFNSSSRKEEANNKWRNYNLNKRVHLSSDCKSKMVVASIDELVFNSALQVYFQAGYMNLLVKRLPVQSILNTASWQYIVPQLYVMYPNDPMALNISISSPPAVTVIEEKLSGTLYADVIVDVMDGNNTVPVACIQVEVAASGNLTMSGDSITGAVGLDDFALTLKWSNVGNLYMPLAEGIFRVLLNDVLMPLANILLEVGIPLPAVHGFSLQDPYIYTSNSALFFCSDIAFSNSTSILLHTLRNVL